ncbi:MAG: leucine-rich repeat protein [Paludibacteraceae bacterium]|nr:leucine-rich repeat protein [Paludibacteraceae bacterium]
MGAAVFAYCSGLASILIHDGVGSIGESAFFECSSLTSIEIPSSVRYIGPKAFGSCSELSVITVDKNNTVYDSRDNCNAIIETATNVLVSGCKNTKIPNSVTSIGKSAFIDCTEFSSIEIPNSVTSIGESAFKGCSGLTSIDIPSSVMSIGSTAFGLCTELNIITVDENNAIYDSRDNCNAIIETATNVLISGCKNTKIPNSVTSIGECAFYGCSGLTSLKVPNKVTEIGNDAFMDCSNLISIELPNSITAIGRYAFLRCKKLVSIEMPNSVMSIGEGSFGGCSGLTSMVIPSGITSIGERTFGGCSGLTSIVIPRGVISIGEGAFSDCSGLTSIEMPNSITEIEKWAFYNCTGLTSIICYAQTPPELDNYAFQLVKKSIPVYIPYGSIDDYTSARGWSEFTNFKYLPADPVDEELDEPKVTPEKTSVVIAWPVDESAETYIINTTKEGVTVCSLTFDANGNVVTIDYPSNGSTKGAELRDANALPNGYSYEITGLEEGTEYVYTVTAQNGSGVTVAEYSGTFRTQGGAVSVEEYNTNSSSSLQNAIIVNGKSISVNGAEPSDIIIYNTAGKQVSNPVPASGVYVVKVGDEAVKVMVK